MREHLQTFSLSFIVSLNDTIGIERNNHFSVSKRMNMMTSIDELVETCAEEQQEQTSESKACYELFHLALVEEMDEAWTAVYQQFQTMVVKWTYEYSQFHHLDETADAVVNEAFERFWRYARKPAKKGKLPHLGMYLRYLKRCVGSTIEENLRRAPSDVLQNQGTLALTQMQEEGLADTSYTLETFQGTAVQALWQTIGDNELEKLVATCMWVYDMSPRHIVDLYPEQFSNTTEVSNIRRNLLRRLKRHPKIQTWSD